MSLIIHSLFTHFNLELNDNVTKSKYIQITLLRVVRKYDNSQRGTCGYIVRRYLYNVHTTVVQKLSTLHF